MKRVSRVFLLAFFGLLLLGSANAYAGGNNNQGQNNQGQKNQGQNNQGNGGVISGIINWIEGVINDIFGNNNQGGNNQGNNTTNNTPTTTGGGGTAPIDGGISLLLLAGAGLGVRKMASRRK